jgi:hypothetical protein
VVSQLPEVVESEGMVPFAVKVVIGPPKNLALADADDPDDDCPDSAMLSHITADRNKPKLSANLIMIRFMQLLLIS